MPKEIKLPISREWWDSDHERAQRAKRRRAHLEKTAHSRVSQDKPTLRNGSSRRSKKSPRTTYNPDLASPVFIEIEAHSPDVLATIEKWHDIRLHSEELHKEAAALKSPHLIRQAQMLLQAWASLDQLLKIPDLDHYLENQTEA